MGACLSKRAAAQNVANGGNSASRMEGEAGLSSYEVACRLDPEVKSFDATLQRSTSRVISAIAVDVDVTRYLIEMNQEVVKVILERSRDIWKNPKLLDLVEEHLNNSQLTLEFCAAMEKCLKKARESQEMLHVALQRFEEAEQGDGEERYTKMLEELKDFRASGDPFSAEFFKMFQSVYQRQMSTLEKLLVSKSKLDKKLKSVRAWRKVSCIIFAATFAAVLICSVVAAAVAAPPVLTALTTAASVALGSAGKWFHSLWKNYQDEIQNQKELVNAMNAGSYIAIKDLENIRALVAQLEIQIDHLVRAAGFTLMDQEAMRFGVEEIKTKLGKYTKSIEDLGEKAERSSAEIKRVRSLLFQRIIATKERSKVFLLC
ncbi:unnamed protein product [Spirodela intermedia]|uniref:Uncharacterized protein n=1 Tax=Spirodela intermedia TaxID=51605 RepID=A0A7I8JBD2_SPIIN|nr:unnamed protein product [Spirodela intermedia]CAA6667420.1 unnamed protein product [Spirodela intermedia]